jgi:UPF0755 protein
VKRAPRRLGLGRLFLFFVAALLLAAGAAFLVVRTPYGNFAGDSVLVDIPSGTPTSSILRTLEEKGVIRNRKLAYATFQALFQGETLKAGEYRFEGRKTIEEVLRVLVEGKVVTYRITIPEGLTAEEIFDLVAREGLATADELRSFFEKPGLFDGIPHGAPTLEGFLGPETHVLTRSQGARGIVSTFVRAFVRSLPERFGERARALGRTPLEAVTLASLVEKETGVASDRALVSAVYHNRLRAGMLLQCDPTTVYALRRKGLWTGDLTREGLAFDDPYNTYVCPGLPPGPIASPGAAALEAAVAPADVPYLYFVAIGNGSGEHRFAVTYDEHLVNVARFRRARAAQETAAGAPR